METKTEVNNRIRKEVSKDALDVSRIYLSDFQKEGTETAELRQSVTTKSFYPTKAIANDKQDNVFGMDDFGFGEKEFTNVENRVAWIDVPAGTTIEKVREKLAQHKGAGLYRILANKPILTDNQEYAVRTGISNMDVFANSQVVRYPENSENPGELALDINGKPQYRAIFFKTDAPEDQDLRSMDGEYYASPEIQREMASGVSHVVAGQNL